MRIISQNGLLDVPYELIAIFPVFREYGNNRWNISRE